MEFNHTIDNQEAIQVALFTAKAVQQRAHVYNVLTSRVRFSLQICILQKVALLVVSKDQ